QEPARNDDRDPLDAQPLELVCRGRDRKMARAHRGPGEWQRRLLDDDRRRAATRDEALERLARKRERERVARRLWNVVERLALRRRPQDDLVRGRLDGQDPRVREQRFGQKRDASRLTDRQSTVIDRKPCSLAQFIACAVSARPMPAPRAMWRVMANARSTLFAGTRR